MEKEFSEFNGYPIKDLVARAEIEQLKKKALTFKVIAELPTENIEENTLYLKPTGKTGSNKYTAHMYVNGEWEDFETLVEIDLSGYYTSSEIDEKLAANKKYVDDTCVKRVTGTPTNHQAYGYNTYEKTDIAWNMTGNQDAWTIPMRGDNGNFKVSDLTESSDPAYVANKKYVDEQIQALKTQLGI